MKSSEEENYSITSDQHLDTVDAVEAAIEALTDSQIVRLLRYAHLKLRGCRIFGQSRDGEDCFQEAIARTLEGSRRWNRQKVDFFGHLLGAIRSISDQWRKQSARAEKLSELLSESDTSEKERLQQEEKMAQLRLAVADDPQLGQLIDLHLLGLTGPQIQEHLQICSREYETRMKKLYRRARKSRAFL